MATPTEPARGPTLALRAEDGLPPFERSAAIAFLCSVAPLLFYASATITWLMSGVPSPQRGGAAVFWLLFFCAAGLAFFVGPIVGIIVGTRTVGRLRAIPEEVRRRGLRMAIAARVLGLVCVCIWVLPLLIGFAVEVINSLQGPDLSTLE
jgi:hypothetical protein